MDKFNKRESREYCIVDESLRSYPLQPTPPDLLPEVMRRIQKHQTLAWYSPQRGWIYAMCLPIVIIFILAWRAWSLLPLDWIARAQVRLLMWQHNLNYLLPQYGFTVGLLSMLVGLGLLAGMFLWLAKQYFCIPQKPKIANFF